MDEACVQTTEVEEGPGRNCEAEDSSWASAAVKGGNHEKLGSECLADIPTHEGLGRGSGGTLSFLLKGEGEGRRMRKLKLLLYTGRNMELVIEYMMTKAFSREMVGVT